LGGAHTREKKKRKIRRLKGKETLALPSVQVFFPGLSTLMLAKRRFILDEDPEKERRRASKGEKELKYRKEKRRPDRIRYLGCGGNFSGKIKYGGKKKLRQKTQKRIKKGRGGVWSLNPRSRGKKRGKKNMNNTPRCPRFVEGGSFLGPTE